jgi:hypothetical protein
MPNLLSHIKGQEYTLKLFENEVLRRILGAEKRKELADEENYT